jgi:hypothetical protein
MRNIRPLDALLPNTRQGILAALPAGGVSDTDADSVARTVRQFEVDAGTWMNAHHPHLI